MTETPLLMDTNIDFKNYTLEELYDCAQSIDRKSYPERAKQIDELIVARKAQQLKFEPKTIEAGFLKVVFSRDIGSLENSNKILKFTFACCSLPLVLVGLLHVFFPSVFSQVIGADQYVIFTAYLFGAIKLILGWSIFKKSVVGAYTLILFWIGPELILAFNDKSFPSFSLFDMTMVLLIFASIRSIKYLKQEN